MERMLKVKLRMVLTLKVLAPVHPMNRGLLQVADAHFGSLGHLLHMAGESLRMLA
jgi:hypothetical protein